MKDESEACEGSVIDNMSDEELMDFVDGISVYARVSPEHKIRIVRAWQNKGNIVAMTGDGVNDARHEAGGYRCCDGNYRK